MMRAFTLLEILIVISMFTVVAGLTAFAGLHTHSGFTAQDDESLAIALLQKARNQSMSGICQGNDCSGALPHGVHTDTNGLVLFQGAVYIAGDTANEYVQAQSNGTAFGGNDIIFAPFSGDTQATGTLVVYDNGATSSVIIVGSQGQIIWSK